MQRDSLSSFIAGEMVGDFEIISQLGRGAAGTVYLARQRSLDRRVALKITRDVGSEALTMASLEHPHIVQVFSETVELQHSRRLLCMQYVAGTTLAAVIQKLRQLPRSQLSGRALLDAIDELSTGQSVFDADALRSRELLEEADYLPAACWIIARLAEALHFAHLKQVLHRDIKPANILVDLYGRPSLADFSLSRSAAAVQDDVFGGTLPYMSPEHLDAFNPSTSAGTETVDERSDIYSLGVVLYELLALALPFPVQAGHQRVDATSLAEMANQRRTAPPRLRDAGVVVSLALEAAVGRCLAAAPQDRFADAGQFSSALDGCREMEKAVKKLPAAGPLTRLVVRYPLGVAIPLSFLPHLAGNLFTPAYNFLILFPGMTAAQKSAVIWTSGLYGVVMFPTQAALVVALFGWAARVWVRINRGEALADADVDLARQRLLAIPPTALWMAVIAWAPLLFCIPLCLEVTGTGMRGTQWWHFVVSIGLSLLVATTYTLLILQYFVVRIYYPSSWASAAGFVAASRRELAPVPKRTIWLQMGAALIPLLGAIFIVFVGPDAFEASSYLAFRALVVALILFGMGGMAFAMRICSLINRSVIALTGSTDGK